MAVPVVRIHPTAKQPGERAQDRPRLDARAARRANIAMGRAGRGANAKQQGAVARLKRGGG
jgi:hypothetical protein